MANDLTNPQYFLRENSTQLRRVGTLSGRGTYSPGYRLVGEGSGAPSEQLQRVRILKMVSPLTGQGSAAPGGGWRYQNRNLNTLNVNRRRVSRSVAPNTGSRVVRPPVTAIRRMTGRGQGVVGYV